VVSEPEKKIYTRSKAGFELMVSVTLAVLGILCFISGFFGFNNPQRLYEIRQIPQTQDDPQLSDFGEFMWKIISVGMCFLGIYTIWYSLQV
jgi:hypothetical protein